MMANCCERIVDADRPRRQAQGLPQFRIGHGGDARRAMPAEIDRHFVGLPVIQRSQYAFSTSHARVSSADNGMGR